ncbi:DNA-directed RNA polymerase subunit B'' [Halorubrum vacuolatum]|uniref:DNA-directed RNA polymerase n=1 Tax=Halorubrum vacuolatum TaxID=63740 RepID=A0A238W992_HALVU|nr:DNA-directed RNA polymerase subunit B'' [Halorubrum vacuolatum]SNR43146.1 DNA-directed RNA polymerase subunit B [Halorubrum vacuolatum]
MHREKRQRLAQAYLSRQNVAAHHLHSFNRFLEAGLQTVVKQKGPIHTSIGNQDTDATSGNESHEEPLVAKITEIRVESPQFRESDGKVTTLYPQEARHRNLTYAAPMFLTIQLIIGGNQEPKSIFKRQEVKVGKLPIMVRSHSCNLAGLSPSERINKNEDPLDPGGYFIVNGNERVLISTEDLASNRILTAFAQRSGTKIPEATTYSRRRGYRNITRVVYDKNDQLAVSFPGVSGMVSFTTAVCALGMETDDDIYQHFSDDEKIIRILFSSLETRQARDRDAALVKIGSNLAPKQSAEQQREKALEVFDQRLLPHLTESRDQQARVRYSKAIHLCRMAEACLNLYLGRKEPEDKDHYKNQRLRVAGDLMREQFRAVLNRFGRDLKYQIERTYKRNRKLSIPNLIQSDLIGNRLEAALATGNWVGGRSGVSQFVDRTNMPSLLSQLRRVQSPLSRGRPHFDARDLHATHWGRICPSETPEGPNCGLVKHLAQATDLSTTGIDERILKDELVSMGVRQTDPH